jgi:low temperature requirement protein LtrA
VSTPSIHGRRVTWVELFFDLIFVAAVSQVAAPLHERYSLAELTRFTPLFVLIWWAWSGHTLFSSRFNTDDIIQRLLTLTQIFAVAVMAANAKDALDSRSSAGFAAAYGGVRLVLVAQYMRARHVVEARPLTIRYLLGHGVAALLWLLSAAVPAPGRFWIWGVAFLIDFGTPWLADRHSTRIPHDAAHLPERFGLFTLILLGEAVVAVMRGMESQENWPALAAISAIGGMAVLFAVCWWYFDGATVSAAHPIRSRRDAIVFQVWSHAHLPLYLGVVVVGVGIERVVTAAAHTSLNGDETAMLVAASVTVVAAMLAITATSGGGYRANRMSTSRSTNLHSSVAHNSPARSSNA